MDQPETFDFDLDEAVKSFQQWLEDNPDLDAQGTGGPLFPEQENLAPKSVFNNAGTNSSVSSLLMIPDLGPGQAPFYSDLQHFQPQEPLVSTFSSPPRLFDPSGVVPQPSSQDAAGSFCFKSRAVVLEDRSTGTQRQQVKPTDAAALECKYPGCTSRRTFRRKYELQRHMKKHTSGNNYQCPLNDCKESFYRLDKCRLHVREKHDDNEIVTCPVPNCSTKPMPLDILRLHIGSHGRASPMKFLRQVLRDGYTGRRHCPIDTCTENVEYGRMHVHLRSHRSGERKDNEEIIRAAGVDPDTLEVVCPICCQNFQEQAVLNGHIQLAHIVTDAAHFQIWGNYVESLSGWALPSNDGLCGMPAWTSWYLLMYAGPLKCPECGQSGGDTTVGRHQMTLLEAAEKIYPYRYDILRMWPSSSATRSSMTCNWNEARDVSTRLGAVVRGPPTPQRRIPTMTSPVACSPLIPGYLCRNDALQ